MHTLLVARPVFLTQFLLEYLSRPAFWKRVKKLYRLGNLETRQPGPAVVDQLLFIQRLSRLYYHQGFWNFAPSIIRHRDHRAFEDARMRVHGFLNLDGSDVFAAGNNDVFFAIDDHEVAVLIHCSHVAGMEPSVAHRGSGLFGQLPVAGHHVVGAYYHFADALVIVWNRLIVRIDDFDLHSRHWKAGHRLTPPSLFVGFVFQVIFYKRLS